MGSLGEEDLAQELRSVGSKLLHPPADKDELLNLLDRAELILSKVEQAPSDLVKDSLLAAMKALSAKELLKYLDMDVKVSVLSCITEITRISAPDAPFGDELMKEIFELTVATFEKLSLTAGRCYSKAVLVLANVARMRLCVVMLDLECEGLIIKMFQTFLAVIRSDHPLEIFSSMEAIMTVTIEESEEISPELLNTLLDSVKKENQNTSKSSWKLGNQVIENCTDVLKPCLVEAMRSGSIAVWDYSPLVISLCQNVSDFLKHNVNGSVEHLEGGKTNLTDAMDIDVHSQVGKRLMEDVVRQKDVDSNIQTTNDDSSPRTLEPCQVRKSGNSGVSIRNEDGLELMEPENSESHHENIPHKRGRKPNSLMKPDEGYDNSWIGNERRARQLIHQKRRLQPRNSLSKGPPMVQEKNIDFENLSAEVAQSEIAHSLPDRSSGQVGQRKKKNHIANQEAEAEATSLSAPKVISGLSLEETQVRPAVDSTKQDCEDTSVSEEKQRRRLKINSIESVAKVDSRNIGKKGSLLQKDVKKKMQRTKSPLKGDIAEGFCDKAMDSGSALLSKMHESELDGSSLNKKVKRKRTLGKGEAPRSANGIIDLGENLVGRLVKVWWPMDRSYYEGVVNSFDPVAKRHQVVYLDGDVELLNLKEELWSLIPYEGSPDEDKKAELMTPNAPSGMRRRKKGNGKLEHLGKQLKAEVPSKRDAALV